ncbi:hypothetical protein KGA66_13005 [Actinocrinis puniceicyclus]|uniref:Uncharacterized protein n=1 Tax=Actinocrinis puniceicyclus TaxID=977794 RepID=A0A8J8BCB3_9ACTN|nr:hypothetical protein [Actinocrinis puniceicyclus]MBS2963968.1 hypothetical protein [Actinocrinis puniceicyclus]
MAVRGRRAEPSLVLPGLGDFIGVLPRLDRVRARAANTQEEAAPLETEWSSDERDMRCVLREAGPDEVELIIEAYQLPPGQQLFEVRVATVRGNLDFLVPATTGDAGWSAAALSIPDAGSSVEVAVLRLRPATSLGAGDLPVIGRSVRSTGGAGHAAWDAIRGRLPEGDPVREGISAEL